MRAQYNIGLGGLLLSAAALAAPCPPALTKVAASVAQLRGVTGPFSPPCRLIEPRDLRAELDRKLRRDLPVPPQLFIESLVRLGFVSGEPSAIYQNLLTFYTTQVLGFYEPQADEMVVVNTPSAGRVEGAMVWAHELAHAVQEHRFHLPSRLLAMRSDSDEQRAASAVAEGEAMLVMLVLNLPSSDPDALERAARAVGQQATALGTPAGVPDYFVADLVFPYTTGFDAVLHAYRRGGWGAVDRLLKRPPTSTAALLHPDRPGAPGQVPESELPPVPDGWEEVLTDTVGEWGLSYLLGRRMQPAQAAALASGWDGDCIRLIRDRTDLQRWGVAWRLRARSVEERASLEAAMRRELPGLLTHLAPPGPPSLTWAVSGRTLEVRATWPSGPGQPRPRPPS
jgi:hypothetical protein